MSHLSDPDQPRGPLNAYNAWSVEIISGAEFEPVEGVPTEFGADTIYVGNDGEMLEPNVVYGPVGLRIVQGEAFLFVNDPAGATSSRPRGGSRNFRFMNVVTDLEFDWDGRLRLVGLEERKDGALVRAVWEAWRVHPDKEDLERSEAMLEQLFEQLHGKSE